MDNLANSPDDRYAGEAQPLSSDPEISMRDRPSLEDMVHEIVSRSRRIETRVTTIAVAQGVGIQAQKPEFEDGCLYLPSRHSTLNECLNAIPKTWSGPVWVYVGDVLVTTLGSVGTTA